MAQRSHFTESLPVAFSPDGARLYVPDGTGQLETLDTDTLSTVHAVPVGTGIGSLQANPRDGSVLALRVDGSVARVDPAPGTSPPRRHRGRCPPTCSPASSRRTATSWPPPTRPAPCDCWTSTSLRWVGPGAGADWGYDRDYAPDGSQIAAVRSDRISLWDGHTGAYVASLPLPLGVTSVSIAYLRGQLGPRDRVPERFDLDRGHPDGHLDRPSLPDGRSQPHGRRVGAVLPQPALPGDLPPVADGSLTGAKGKPRAVRRSRER